MNKFKAAPVQCDATEPDNAENTEPALRSINEAKREKADAYIMPANGNSKGV